MDITDLKKTYDFNILPKDLKLSTFSACCKLNVDVLFDNIFKYLELEEYKINMIKFCNKFITHLCREPVPVETKKKKRPPKIFYNQLTFIIYSDYSKKNINTKLFKNGSIQMSGCKHIEDIINILNILKNKLSNTRAIIENNIIIEKPFIKDNKEINITNFTISLINTNFKIPFQVEREIFYNILITNRVNCRYEPCKHACVNIKYSSSTDENIKASIFVFQSGHIIIAGTKTINVIIEAYEYIKTLLKTHIKEIIIANIPL
jgi:TATA-box binding protein (TBP) (component of TFIID and TFIIIB)